MKYDWLKRPGDCSWEDCMKPRSGTSSYCAGHLSQYYRRGERYMTALQERNTSHDGCSFEGCTEPYSRGGYCKSHYMQSYRGYELKPLRKKVAA